MTRFNKIELNAKLKPQVEVPLTKIGSIFDGA